MLSLSTYYKSRYTGPGNDSPEELLYYKLFKLNMALDWTEDWVGRIGGKLLNGLLGTL
jgi:hypothetical protein